VRIESAVTSLSWIPSEAVTSEVLRLPFDMGVTHYDDPPPDVVDDLEQLRLDDRFRFANELRAWVEVEDGTITASGYAGEGHMGATRVQLGPATAVFQAVALPDVRAEPEVAVDAVRFVQTTGGRAGIPAPRRVRHRPFVQVKAPLVWTTLALTIAADGSSTHEVVGASPFPRHWVYDRTGTLTEKVGLAAFEEWYRTAFGPHSPWGDEDSAALVTAAESALERTLSPLIMRGAARPTIRSLPAGATVCEQGRPGDELFLLLDGVVAVEVDGEPLAELGPGAVLGERAGLEGGRRTATLRTTTPARIAVAAGADLDRSVLEEVSQGHRREEQR
jgi:hypothetical protein